MVKILDDAIILAIAILFSIRRFLLKRHGMVEIPDGLIEADDNKIEKEC